MNLQRAVEYFDRLVARHMGRLPYHALWPARVVGQDNAGNLELVPDDAAMPGEVGVPIRLGLPGCEVKVKPGTRVLLGYEQGDPRKPYASLWEGTELDELKITATTKITVDAPLFELADGAVLPVARATDMAGPYPIVGGNPKVVA
jgi:hypothetical protein